MKKFLSILILPFAFACSQAGREYFPGNPTGELTALEADFSALAFVKDARWAAGDCIGLWGSDKGANEKWMLKRAGDGQPTGVFYGPSVSGASVQACYPWSEDVTLQSGAFPFLLSPEQNYSATETVEDFYLKQNPYAYAFLSDGRLSFNWPAGVLTVSFDFVASETVEEIQLSSRTKPLSGPCLMDNSGEARFVSDQGKTLVLKCNGIASVDPQGKAVPFPMLLLPGRYEGLNLLVLTQESGLAEYPLEAFDIHRPSAAGINLTSLALSVTGLDSFTQTDGYLEE